MKSLNLYRLWEIMNILYNKQEELHKEGKWISFFGDSSSYYGGGRFEDFIEHYSFRVRGKEVVVYSTMCHEDFTIDDFNYIPAKLLNYTNEEVSEWLKDEIKIQLAQLEEKREQDRIYVKQQIEILERRLVMLSE